MKQKQPWYADNKSVMMALSFIVLLIFIVILYISYNKFKIGETGSIGDAFNGFLAPFISLLASLLVYMSFRQQIKANELIQTQWTFERNLEIFNEIKKAYEEIMSENDFGEKKKGVDALEDLIDSQVKKITTNIKQFKKLEYILIELQFLLNRLKTVDSDDKRYIWLKLDLFYVEKLEKNLARFIVLYDRNNWDGNQLFDLNSEVRKFLKIYNERF